MSWLTACLLAALMLGAQVHSAKAQAVQEPPAYRVAVERAIEEFGLGNFEEAREQFAQAQQLYPNARALRGLGMSEFELRNYVEAVGYLERALASDVKPLDGKPRRETEQLLARARGYVGELAFKLSPIQTLVLLDGARQSLSTGGVLRTNVGKHALE